MSTPRRRPIRHVAALAIPLAACGGGDERCDPDAPSTICTIAGTGEDAFSGDGGPATAAALYAPHDIAMSPDGELWVLDSVNYRVRAIDAKGRIRAVIGAGLVGDSPPPGVPAVPALEANLNRVSDLLFAGDHVYLAAMYNSRIKRVRLSDMTYENHAGVGRRTYYDGDGGPALAASLDLPARITLDPAGALVIMDQGNQVIRRIAADGTIHRIAGQCVAEGEGCAPGAPVVACAGTTRYAGSNKLTCGAPDTLCGSICTPGYGGDGGPALAARFAQPYGAQAIPAGKLLYDPAGDLLIADTDNHRIRKIDPAGIITTIAGTGARGYSGDGGPATQAQLNEPHDLALGPDGTLYFSDHGNNCIRKVDPDGIVSAAVGQCSPELADRGFAGDGGPPLAAKLNRPLGIDLVGTKLYISDTYNHRIRVANLR